MLSNAWTYTVQDALAHYGVSEETGLDEYRARENAKLYGKNGESGFIPSCQRFYVAHPDRNWTFAATVLPEEPSTSLFSLILAQFQDQLVLILLGSAVVSFVLACFEDASESGGSWATAFVEPLVIFLILIANAAVGVVQESNAEKAIDVSLAFLASKSRAGQRA